MLFWKQEEGKGSNAASTDRERRRSRDRDRDRDRDRHSDRDRKRHGSKDRDRDRDRHDRKDKNRDRDRDRDRSRRDKRRSKSRDRDRGRGWRRSKSPYKKTHRPRSISKSPIREVLPELTPEERDARTVFCMQLSARIRPRDLEEFFSSVGKVRDVRLITDNKTRRSKGIAYVEFAETDSVPLAMGLNGQKLLGVPIIVQNSQAEKNRTALTTGIMQKGNVGPMRLYVGSLHFNITEEMLRGIFEPFGKIDDVKLMRNHENSTSQGYGFITFHDSEDAKKALEQLNGFELAGRPMKVGHVTERTAENQGASLLDSDEMDRTGIDLGATGRLQLMAKLAEGTGFQIPQYAANALNQAGAPAGAIVPGQVPGQVLNPASSPGLAGSAPPIATQCFMLSNMFDPTSETRTNWDQEVRDDVIEECNKHGGVLHLFVDKASPQGNIYVKCPSIAAAVASVNSLHGRYFAGRVITAAYVPLPNYHSLFPESLRANQLLLSSSQNLQGTFTTGFMAGMQPTIIR
ncbi:RNA-binding protein 39-like isoform X2 [Gigantopelta aegis]|uniref:RNA-binding protein 39-like isoform X2 n=1 Tax=Gigantopelta aegis TaxID=1735272 RepID=UPI001B8891A4|nr:RNA-binding protein 39-like isoform X2 [Gigantopelta aegis]